MSQKEIKVSNCRLCPFVVQDGELGFIECNISEDVTESLDNWEELPSDRVHELCPLKKIKVVVYYEKPVFKDVL